MAFVTAALVIAKDDAGKNVYLYQGTEVPQSIGKEERARLAEYFSTDAAEAPTPAKGK